MKPYTWRAAILKSSLKPTTRHVLITLSCHVNDAGESAYPSTKLLEQETGLSERAVITHLHEAAELGWLVIRKHGYAGQKWARNEYYPTTPDGFFDERGTEPASVPIEKALNVAHEGTERHTEGTEPNDIKALKEVQSNSPIELSIELSIEKVIKRSRAAPAISEAMNVLLQAGVDAQTAADWLKHRKTRRASDGMTVINDRIEQASIARIPLADALKMEISRGWTGFKAEWAANIQARASPYESTKDKSRRETSESLTGRIKNDPFAPSFIDINGRPAELG